MANIRYNGFLIQHDEDGFFWENGPDGDGYFDTVDEAKHSIDAYNAADLASDPSFLHDDTPRLAAPWWEAR